jgi:hypothetical protein
MCLLFYTMAAVGRIPITGTIVKGWRRYFCIIFNPTKDSFTIAHGIWVAFVGLYLLACLDRIYIFLHSWVAKRNGD